MSGHSHWATTHRQKGVNDAKRAAVFTKYGRLITIAAREGTDPAMNFRLRLAVDNARSVNMPKENIERAIKAGSGENKDGAIIEEVLYEAYGPGQVALLIQGLTDNKNRTVSDIKTLLTKNGGKFVPSGSVAFMFRHSGIIVFSLHTSVLMLSRATRWSSPLGPRRRISEFVSSVMIPVNVSKSFVSTV